MSILSTAVQEARKSIKVEVRGADVGYRAISATGSVTTLQRDGIE